MGKIVDVEKERALDEEIGKNPGLYLNFTADLIVQDPDNTALFLRVADVLSEQAMAAVKQKLGLKVHRK